MVSLRSLSGCTSQLNNHFIISDNSKNKKKVYLVEYSMVLTVLGYFFKTISESTILGHFVSYYARGIICCYRTEV